MKSPLPLVEAGRSGEAGAGHYYFGMFPHFPFFNDASLGGTQQANALATEQFWPRMLAFLNQLPARSA